MGNNRATQSNHSEASGPSVVKSVTIDEMLWAITELPVYTQIYKGKNYWTVSYKKPGGGRLSIRNRRLSDALVLFVEGYTEVTGLVLPDLEANTDSSNSPTEATQERKDS